jgi:hypothetical protein
VGDIFDIDPGSSFRGWQLNTSGIGGSDQTFSIFNRDGQEIIAVTTPVVKTARGGIEVEKITKIVFVTKAAGEERLEGYDCSFLGLAPAVAFFDKGTKIARGYFVVRDDVLVRRWLIDEPDLCAYGGD